MSECSVRIDGARQRRTPSPSDLEHAKSLMALTLRKDLKKPFLWAARFVLMPLLLMLYTIGIFLNYQTRTDGSQLIGNYRIFQANEWSYPSKMRLAGFDSEFVNSIANNIHYEPNSSYIELIGTNLSNSSDLIDECQGNISRSAAEEICVFFNAHNSYHIYFGGGKDAVPFQPALAGAQVAVNSAILNISNITDMYPVSQIQRTPEDIKSENLKPVLAILLINSIMYVLSSIIMTQFLIAPITYEKLNGITRSYLLVGVKMRTYLLQWLAYFSLNGIILAGLLTLVSVFYKLMPMSNAGLIFISHYLGLVQLYSMFVLITQFIEQEELAQGIPWMLGLISMAAGTAFLMIDSANNVLFTILSIFSPYIGMMQYHGIYVTYDFTGYNIGIHPGDGTFVESGLLVNMMAQLVGIALWITATLIYASPYINEWCTEIIRKYIKNDACEDEIAEDRQEENEENREDFEPLPPGSEVLVSVRGVQHTYYKGHFDCNKNSKDVEVLKGLNMDICRGEVFGYLGHNGAGKSTSVSILGGELKLQNGNISYHLMEGIANVETPDGAALIRSKIGVCPQENTSLQDDLTCREYLTLFGQLKGGILWEHDQTVDEAVEREVEQRLSEVSFTSDEDADKPVGTFSGGMKRKVMIATALLGDPEVVYLDEPTAGLDPYNRRTIWDMIIAAKKGRSIILTTHFLDEADVLSDRIGIIKNGRLITCGSSLFLKHHFGAGYTLKFNSNEPFDVTSVIGVAERLPNEKESSYEWRLDHGTESTFPQVLSALSDFGATEIALQLTTLEDVFLETAKEDPEEISDDTRESSEDGDNEEQEEIDLENGTLKGEHVTKIWEVRGTLSPLRWWRKFLLVENFMMTNAWKMPGTIALNIIMPLVYLLGGFIAVSLIDIPVEGGKIVNAPIPITPTETTGFFGVPSQEELYPNTTLQPVNVPETIQDYFNGSLPVLGGYFNQNSTLQYSPQVSPFALQLGVSFLTNYSAHINGNVSVSANHSALLGLDSSILSGIATNLQQLPYTEDAPFRVDLLILPMCMAFGFAGMAFVVLDVLLIKGYNIVGLFRVGGITEWSTYLGVSAYKVVSTFTPFFALIIILGLSMKSVTFGNGGRWLATILIMLGYAYSTTPIGLIFAKKFIHSDFKSVANWFPGLYMTIVALPYCAWVSALQALPDERDIILIIGDIICIIPQVAFQRGIGAVIEVSSFYDDENLTWNHVWKFETRVGYSILMMLVIGTFEWYYLYILTTARESQTSLTEEEMSEVGQPIDISDDPDVLEERKRSRVNNEGINARDLVKVFKIPPSKESKSKTTVIKRAVKGVSYGVRENEIYALLGPNGAGKTVVMSLLAGQLSPEHGEVALDGEVASKGSRVIDHLYGRCNVAYCPQVDALFPRKSVEEHLKFYATIRGLDWNEEATHQHVDAIIKLLGLGKHRHNDSDQLSGGYKRRLSMAVAMLGYPKVMLVDECTTGLDPAARRLIWDVLKPDVKYGNYDIPAIILSSHYMDECQQLGTRIGIMIDGEVVTTGSLNRLQDLYCTSYFVEISLQSHVTDDEAEDRVLTYFEKHKMEANVYESLPYHFKLKVLYRRESECNDGTKQLAEIFDLLESNKETLGIKFYSVTKMNLEQIFIDLSRKQFEADVRSSTTNI